MTDGQADLSALPDPGDGDSPYRRIAADLHGGIVSGVLAPRAQLPTVDELATRYSVSHGTAQRAIAVLRTAGLVTVSRGRRAVVRETDQPVSSA